MNTVILTGRLTSDPKISYTASQKAVAKFRIAVDSWKKGETFFFNAEAWEQPAEFLEHYTRKGQRIGVQGRLFTDRFEKDGREVEVYKIKADRVELLESKSEAQRDDDNPRQIFQELNEDCPF